MQILLIKDVDGLGEAGQIKKVADGYARNYLLPKGFATLATAGALKQAEQLKAASERRRAKAMTSAQSLAQRLQGVTLTFKARVGENDRLYGSITTSDMAQQLSQKLGEEFDRRKIEWDQPIRQLGTYQVPVRLMSNVLSTVTVVVEKENAGE